MKMRNRFNLVHADHGASLVEMAVILPLFLLLLFGAVDFGRALYLAIEIQGAAHEGAIYGAQYLSQGPTASQFTTAVQDAAQDDAPNVPNLSVNTPTYGCLCAIGPATTYNASCVTPPTCSTSNVIYRVNVTVTGTYSPIFPWPGLPSSMSFSSSAAMRSAGS